MPIVFYEDLQAINRLVKIRTTLAIVFGIVFIAGFFVVVPPEKWNTRGVLTGILLPTGVTLLFIIMPGAITRAMLLWFYLPMMLLPPARYFLAGRPWTALSFLGIGILLIAILWAFVSVQSKIVAAEEAAMNP